MDIESKKFWILNNLVIKSDEYKSVEHDVFDGVEKLNFFYILSFRGSEIDLKTDDIEYINQLYSALLDLKIDILYYQSYNFIKNNKNDEIF